MSSYRVTLIVGRLRPGATPEQVLPAAADAAGELARVEARDLEVVAGEARIVVRFLADDDAHARSVAGRVVGEVSGLATVPASVITRREGSRWVPVLTPMA